MVHVVNASHIMPLVFCTARSIYFHGKIILSEKSEESQPPRKV